MRWLAVYRLRRNAGYFGERWSGSMYRGEGVSDIAHQLFGGKSVPPSNSCGYFIGNSFRSYISFPSKLEQEKNAFFQILFDPFPTTKRRSCLTLMGTFLGEVHLWLDTVKEIPSKIRSSLNILDHCINLRGQRSGRIKQQRKNACQSLLSQAQKKMCKNWTVGSERKNTQ